MPVPGVRPLPTALKLIQGETRKERLNLAEPKPRAVAPRCPQWLNAEARRIWRKLAPKLTRLGILTEIDGEVLAAFCNTYARYIETERRIEEEGLILSVGENGYRQQNAAVGVSLKYLAQARAFLGELGLTPSSRARLSIGKVAPEDEWEGLLD